MPLSRNQLFIAIVMGVSAIPAATILAISASHPDKPPAGASKFITGKIGNSEDCKCGELCGCCPAEIHVHRKPVDGHPTQFTEERIVHCPCTHAREQ